MTNGSDDHGIGEVVVADLLRAVANALPGWFRRCIEDRLATSARIQIATEHQLVDFDRRIDEMAAQTLQQLREFMTVDVDAQRSNPLAILRSATCHPTALLAELGVHHVERSEFDRRVAPDDVYGLWPATWRDIDESLHDPGVMWGAWKASTVLSRRRAEGKL